MASNLTQSMKRLSALIPAIAAHSQKPAHADFETHSDLRERNASVIVKERGNESEEEYEIVMGKPAAEDEVILMRAKPVTPTAEDEETFDGDIQFDFQGNSLYQMGMESVNEVELDAAIDAMQTRPDILRSMLPCTAPDGLERMIFGDPEFMTTAFSRVRDIIMKDTKLISDAQQKRDGLNQKTEVTDHDSILDQLVEKESSHTLSPLTSREWEELREFYPCAICQDVLAVPFILSCTHSFCSSCLYEYLHYEDDQESDDEDQAISFCPTCREEITQKPLYERALAGPLDNHVAMLPDCEGKRHWKQRQDWHIKREQQKDQDLLRSRGKKDHNCNRAPDEGDQENYSGWVLSILAFAVLALIVLMRH
jgi:hypothetical protein